MDAHATTLAQGLGNDRRMWGQLEADCHIGAEDVAVLARRTAAALEAARGFLDGFVIGETRPYLHKGTHPFGNRELGPLSARLLNKIRRIEVSEQGYRRIFVMLSVR